MGFDDPFLGGGVVAKIEKYFPENSGTKTLVIFRKLKKLK
jgi:hypothetical protein